MKTKNSPIYEFIGKKIKLKRNILNLSQQELADKCGLNRASIVFIEKGAQKFSILRLYKIAQSLGVDVFELLPSIKELPLIELDDNNNSNYDDYSKKFLLEKDKPIIAEGIKTAKKINKGGNL